MLEAARKNYGGKNIVSFIGKTYSGKTVISALLFDTISNEFLRRYGKKFHVRFLKGFDELERAHKRMFSKGRFPPPTLPKTKSEITIEITSKAPLGTKTEFVLRDASGEDLTDILQKPYENPDELINTILTKHKDENDQYGPLSYILFSKIYIILVNCKLAGEWRTEQIRLNQTINSILDIKKKMKGAVDKKIRNPIAIVFTKADELKNALEELKGERRSPSPNELLESYLPLFHSNLELTHSGKLGLFKFGIDGVEEASDVETEEMKREEAQELAEINNELWEEKLKQAQINIQKTIDERVKSVVDKKRQDTLNAGQSADVAEQAAQKAGQEERKIAEEENKIDEPPDYIKSEISHYITEKKRYKINRPIKFSQREYIRFISWIIDNIS